ncbi:MAG: glycosyltransferase family 39 protein [Chloroflexota bacterium]
MKSRVLSAYRVIDRRIDPELLAIMLLPISLLILDSRWAYSPLGFIDGWVYNAYFRDLPQILKDFPLLYYGTRLPWIIPGYVIYHFFPPLIANGVLHLLVYTVNTVSLYLIVRMVFNRRIAFVAALLMGSYSYFLTSIGWDYIDAVLLAYFLLALLCLTWSARSGYLGIGLAGIACAACIYTNLYAVLLVPPLVVYFFFQRDRRHNLMLSGLVFGLGMAVLTVILGLVNMVMGGEFLFFMPSVVVAGDASKVILSDPVLYWMIHASWLAFPLTGLITSIIFLLRRKVWLAARENRCIVLFPALLIFACCLFLSNLVIGRPVPFEFPYYTSLLIPLVFLAFSAQLFIYTQDATDSAWWGIAIAAAVILVLPYGLNALGDQGFPYWKIIPILPGLLCCLGAFIVFTRDASITTKMVFFFALVSLANFTIYPDRLLPFTTHNTVDGFNAVDISFAAMKNVDAHNGLYIWYRFNDPLRPVYVSAAIMPIMIADGRVSDNFPELTSQRLGFYKPLRAGNKMAIFSTDPDALVKARTTLIQNGLDARLIRVVSIHEGTIQFTITLVELTTLLL